MRKLMQLLVAAVLMAGGMRMLHAEPLTVVLPVDQKGQPIPQSDYAGAKYALVSNGSELWISSKPVSLLGVIMSTGATTAFLVFRDTDTANGSGAKSIDRIGYNTAPATLGTQPIIPVPVMHNKGMTVQLYGGTTGSETATVLYRELR